MEIYWFIKKVKKYYVSIRKVYKIFSKEIQSLRIFRFQMAVKIINDIINPDNLILTLLIFKAYPRININLFLILF